MSKSILKSIKAYINQTGALILYGQIGDWWDGLDSKSVLQDLEASDGDEVLIRMHSGGGSVLEGMSIYNNIKNISKKTVIQNDGVMASMAAYIGCAADVLRAPSNALFMFHKPASTMQGNANEVRENADILDTFEVSLIEQIYTKISKKPGTMSREEIAAWLASGKDIWLSAAQAMEMGIVDEIMDPIEITASVDFSSFNSSPPADLITALIKKPVEGLQPEPQLTPTPNATAVSGLNTRVTNADGSVSSQATAVTRPFSSVVSNGSVNGIKSQLTPPPPPTPAAKISAKHNHRKKTMTLETLKAAAIVSAVGQLAGLDKTQQSVIESISASTNISPVILGGILEGTVAKLDASKVSALAAELNLTAADIVAQAAAPNDGHARTDEIMIIGEKAGLEISEIRAFISNEKLSVEQVRAQAIDIVASRNRQNLPGAHHIKSSSTSGNMLEDMTAALKHRANPKNTVSDSNEMVGLGIIDMMKANLDTKGLNTRRMKPNEILANMSSGDFPIAINNLSNHVLTDAYTEAPTAWKLISTASQSTDFKTKYNVTVGGASDLKELGENGEFEHGNFQESKEGYGLSTFGRVFGFNRQMMIDDNLGALITVISDFGNLASRKETAIVWALLKNNTKLMQDGLALFHANHKNLAAAGGAINKTTLSAARLAIRKQTGLGQEFLDLEPALLVVSPEREAEAMQMMAETTPASTGDVNIHARKMDIIVDPRLSDTNNPWYVFAAPVGMGSRVIEHSYLAGSSGPQIATQDRFTTAGIDIRIMHDFGAGLLDYRGAYKNPGVS